MVEGKIIGVDFGGTSIRAGLMSGRRILRLVSNNTLAERGKKAVLEQLVKTIRDAKDMEKIKGIGIGAPGPLLDGVIKNPPNIPLENFNLKNFLQRKFKTKVKIENDANCAALAELRYGARKKNMIILTLGTGVGGGIIVNNELCKGEGYAGEIGHIVIQDKKDLEFWASGSTITREAKKVFGKRYLAGELKKLKNIRAERILKKAACNLGVGIANLINIFDPEVVVLVGGLKDAGNMYISMVRREAQRYSVLPKKVNIQWTKLKNSGVLGAGLLLK